MGSENDIERADDHVLHPAEATPPRARPPGADHGLRWSLNNMLAGLQEALPEGSVIRVNGRDRARADVLSELQSLLAQYALVDSSHAEQRALRAQLRAAKPAARALRQRLKEALVTRLGRNSPDLSRFGMEIRDRRKPTVQRQALAAEKARRTRALRGTKGPRQKAAIRFVGEPTLVLNAADAGGQEARSSQGALFEARPALAMIDPDTS
jgi:hypothetical protein